jgi:hypothetical protein
MRISPSLCVSVFSGCCQSQRAWCILELAPDVEGLRLVLRAALGERYRVRVADDGATVGLWRR